MSQNIGQVPAAAPPGRVAHRLTRGVLGDGAAAQDILQDGFVALSSRPSPATPRPRPAASTRRSWLVAAREAGPGLAGSRSLAFATLSCWLIAEALGAYMLSRWIASHGARRPRAEPGGVPRSVIFGHAGLAFTGFAAWVSFLATGSPAIAWLAICLLVPAIGLGISIVTVWTPYPARRAAAGAQSPTAPDGDLPAGTGSGETLARALSDESLTSKLVDDLLADLLAIRPAPRRGEWPPAPP